MAQRFELHLQGMDAPAGLINADRLVEIVKSLQEMATRLGRLETDSATRGRPSKTVERVARLCIGLEKGSTTVVVEREVAHEVLEFDLPDEEAVDHKLAELFEGIGTDHRPEWVSDSLASSAEDLVVALQRTAPQVDVRLDGISRTRFSTSAIHRDTWKPLLPLQPENEVKFTGRLFAVNLNTHRLQVQDDVGNQVALPKFVNDLAVKHLIGSYVTVTGTPERDVQGRISGVLNAEIDPVENPLVDVGISDPVSLEEIIANAPGLEPGGLVGLTDAEADAFFSAMGM